MDKDALNGKHGRSRILDLNESREGFCRRGRGRSVHVDGPETEKAPEPTARISTVPDVSFPPSHYT